MTKANKKQSHIGRRNGALFCFNCGGHFHLPVPMTIDDLKRKIKAFEVLHKDCPVSWSPPTVDQSLPEAEKAKWWMNGMNGERGISSEAMWSVMFAGYGKKDLPHPHDPDDLRRCYLLLQTVPEWKEKLHLMKSVSPVWEKLIDNWELFTTLLEDQLRGKTNDLYTLMKEIGC